MTEIDRVDDPRTRRTAIFPVVALPGRPTEAGGYILVASGVLSFASGLVRAVSYRLPPARGSSGFELTRRLRVVDRLQLLATGAGPLTALLLVLGVVCLVMASRAGTERDRGRAIGLGVAAAAAALVLVSDAALAAAILANGSGTFVSSAAGDRIAAVSQLLAPIALAGGALYYVWAHMTSAP